MARKIAAALIAVFMMIALCACSASESESDSGSSGTLEPIPKDPAYSGTDIKDSPFVGTWTCSWSSLEHSGTDDSSWDNRKTTLVCREDGTFELTFDSMKNGTENMVSVSGTFKVEDDTATCSIDDYSSSDYLGSDVAEFRLELSSSTELKYRGDQMGAVADRDRLTKNS